MLFDGEQRSAPTPAAFQTTPPKITPGLRKYYCLVIGRTEPGGGRGVTNDKERRKEGVGWGGEVKQQHFAL